MQKEDANLAIQHVEGHPHTHATEDMEGAASKFLTSLSSDQKAKAAFTYTEGERVFWYYPPLNRRGLPLRDMDQSQRDLAYAVMDQ